MAPSLSPRARGAGHGRSGFVRRRARKDAATMVYQPTRDPRLINRRRLIGFLSGAVTAGVISRSQALAYLQDASKTGITAENWNPETVRALAGTREVDTAADLHALVPESTEATLQYWNVGPNEASAQIDKDSLPGVPRHLGALLSRDHPRQSESSLRRHARQDPDGGYRRRGARRGENANFVGRGVCRPRRLVRGDSGGVRLDGRAVLARRAQVGDVGRQALRRADQ